MHTGNRLLELFGEQARDGLSGAITVQLEARQVLQGAGMPALYAYFPVNTVVSLISSTEDGAAVEVGLVGREGMIGLAGVLGTIEGVTSAIVQVPGAAIRVPMAQLKAVRVAHPSVRSTLDRYIEARLVQTAQGAACNRVHPVQARLARWLLGVHDRIGRNEFVIGQEPIADLLGVHRPTVTVALQRIEDAGAIARRGRTIVVVNRHRLEGLACECHRVLALEFHRLLGARREPQAALASAPASADPVPSEADPALEAMREIAGRLLLVSIREQESRQQAEEASRAKDQFLATVSHELRNPLNAILGWCALLREQTGVPTRGLDVIADNARAQLTLVEDLLDAARINSSTLSVRPATVSLTDLAERAVDSVRPAADARHLTVRLTIAPDVPAITADADRLRQVLTNVLMNSLKFTNPGGSVDVLVSAADGRTRVRIQDTGQGIAPDLLPHVFDRFRQGVPTEARHQGLGLGLAIARAIVELHGGTMAVDSPGVNQGTTCTIELPLDGGVAHPPRTTSP